ncbi:hypothetical protein SBY92_002994 [Candida maltosa Xu316]
MPKFNINNHSRISSNHDISSSTILPYNRTISSSSSIISTPSNNIKKFQRQRQQEKQQQQHHHQQPPRASKNTRLVKTKLLNLQQSSRQQLMNRIKDDHNSKTVDEILVPKHNSFPPHLLGNTKPPSPNTFDCSVFTNVDVNRQSHSLFTPIKESKVKAWESAEKVAQSIIFDNDDSDSDAFSDDDKENCVVSIPGYTKGELELLNKYSNLSTQEEKKILSEYKRKLLSQHERNLNNDNSITFRRQLQINRKKEILSRLFNDANNLNLEYITNNYINELNLHTLINEDNQEIEYLLEEDGNFKILQEEVKHNIFHTKKVIDNDNENNNFDYDRFQNLTSKKLDKIHDILINKHENITEDEEYKEPSFYSDDVSNLELEEELVSFTVAYLRQNIKDLEPQEE